MFGGGTGDHGGIISTKFQRRKKDLQPMGLGRLVEMVAQTTVGRDASPNANGFEAMIHRTLNGSFG
jgi:hypothetical protein